MLDVFQLSDLRQYVGSMPDCKEKQLFEVLLFEYCEYAQNGSPEDCASRREWMSYSIDDIRVNFSKVVKGLREEVDNIRSEYQPKTRKRGRPPKGE